MTTALHYKHLGLIVKPNLSEKDTVVAHVLTTVEKLGATVYKEEESCHDVPCLRHHRVFNAETPLDAMLVIGGDGTILRSIRALPKKSIPIIGINRGTVGFLAEVAASEVETVLPSLLCKEGKEEWRALAKVEAYRNNQIVFESFALNEVTIAQGAMSRLIDLRTSINGSALADFHADGLIIATPTGSTAYSLAAGGPIVHPHLDALVLTPISPHSLTQKPVVIPGGSTVDVTILQSSPGEDVHVSITVDGQVYSTLHTNDVVQIATHPEHITFVRRTKDTFYHTLRSKLRWGERV